MKYSLYPGCAGEATAKEAWLATRSVLGFLGMDVSENNAYSCCGAGIVDEEDPDFELTLNARNFALAEKEKRDIVVICNTCLLTMLKAALNRAFKDGEVSDDTAWRRVKPFEKVGANRELFLTDQQVRRLLDHTSGAFHDLVKVGILTGARYGELITAKVADFDPHEGTLKLSGKTGNRTVYLSDHTVKVLKQITADKLPKAYLMARDDGDPWGPSHQFRPMREAVKAARLPAETIYYSLRHYHVSKALKAGMPAQVVAENTGTSVRMLEKHYGKFMKSDRRAMMNGVELA